jgi:hypothetical protein
LGRLLTLLEVDVPSSYSQYVKSPASIRR